MALGSVSQRQLQPDWERLLERHEDFRMGVVPASHICLTAGADLHGRNARPDQKRSTA
ncbi:terminase gpA endonuclease subunit [Roseomonas sp. GC11]|uniref:terminase gpA endonuclease subunit n=1 Tax=Roseomonas sp. GC11 TaxID=2950546 RepID=UPI00351E83F5